MATGQETQKIFLNVICHSLEMLKYFPWGKAIFQLNWAQNKFSVNHDYRASIKYLVKEFTFPAGLYQRLYHLAFVSYEKWEQSNFYRDNFCDVSDVWYKLHYFKRQNKLDRLCLLQILFTGILEILGYRHKSSFLYLSQSLSVFWHWDISWISKYDLVSVKHP